MKWLYRIISLLYGCRHKWELLHKINEYIDDGDIPHSFKYVMQCSKCGDIKSRKV